MQKFFKYFDFILVFSISFLLYFFSPISVFGATGLIDSCTTGSAGDTLISANQYIAVGNTFTATSSTISFNEVAFYDMRQGNPTGSAYAKLYVYSGGSVGSLLATSNAVDVTAISNSTYTWVNFYFPNGYTLNNGSSYLIVQEFNAGSAGNGILNEFSTSCTQTGARYDYASGTWNITIEPYRNWFQAYYTDIVTGTATSTSTSTPLLVQDAGNVSFLLTILISLMFLMVVGFFYNNLTLKKPWH